MKKIQLFILNCLIIALSSCDSFLDIVPDDIATIDNAFTMRGTGGEIFVYLLLLSSGSWPVGGKSGNCRW